MMKRLFSLILLVASAGCAVGETPPTVISQLTSNVTSTSGYLNMTVNPNGTNVTAWFNFGTTPAMGTILSNQFIGAGSTNVSLTALVNGLLPGTRYYYQAQGSNDTQGVVSGNLEQFATTQVSYQFTGPGWTNIDPTRPQQSEPVSVTPSAIQQMKAATIDWINAEHNLNGTHQNNFIQTAYVQDGAITLGKLAQSVQQMILNPTFSNSTANVLLTNALTFANSVEYPGSSYNVAAAGMQLLSTTLTSNTFRKVMITIEGKFGNYTGANRNFSLAPLVNGVIAGSTNPTVLVAANREAEFAHSWIVTGGQTNLTSSISIMGYVDLSSTNNSLAVYPSNLRVWGIP